MKGTPEERRVALGIYMTETGAAMRSAAQKFDILSHPCMQGDNLIEWFVWRVL